jgi:hypothetical protein
MESVPLCESCSKTCWLFRVHWTPEDSMEERIWCHVCASDPDTLKNKDYRITKVISYVNPKSFQPFVANCEG